MTEITKSVAGVVSEAPAPALGLSNVNGYLAFDAEECAEQGALRHETYVRNQPFPHLVIDNFLDAEVLRRVVREFPAREKGRFSDDYSQRKTGYKLAQIKSSYINSLLVALNSAAFLAFLGKMTGIDGLISDDYFTGGGLHETGRGGYLSIHADFNTHPHTHLRRRLNLILYLNEDWPESYGGALELWDRNMTACQVSAVPILGRAVVFNTDTRSYHGHPEPMACPEGRYRRSIALYYYTAAPRSRLFRHTTLFQPRPGSKDARLSLRGWLVDRGQRVLTRLHH